MRGLACRRNTAPSLQGTENEVQRLGESGKGKNSYAISHLNLREISDSETSGHTGKLTVHYFVVAAIRPRPAACALGHRSGDGPALQSGVVESSLIRRFLCPDSHWRFPQS